jgi:hypothetical protein
MIEFPFVVNPFPFRTIIYNLCALVISTMGMFDQYEVLSLQKLQKISEKKAIALKKYHNRLHTEVTGFHIVVAQLQTENV